MNHLVIPEPQHTIPALFQPLSSLLVVSGASHMLPTINLNNQPRFQAHKVQYVATQGMLSAESIASDLLLSKVLPKSTFGISHFEAQSARTAFGPGVDSGEISHNWILPPSSPSPCKGEGMNSVASP